MATYEQCMLTHPHEPHSWSVNLGAVGGMKYYLCNGVIPNPGFKCCEYWGLEWPTGWDFDPADRSAAPAETRQVKAFRMELAAHPGVPPGPTALNARLGKVTGKTNVISWSRLRAHLLHSSGFRFNHENRRWEKADA